MTAGLRDCSTASLCTVLQDQGVSSVFMHQVRPLPGVTGRFVGRAFTLRSVAAREDRIAAERARAPELNLQRRAAEECPAGHVLVIDCRGDSTGASGGFILFERMRLRGCAGVVSDGGVRDAADIAASGFSVYAKAPCPPNSRVAHQFVELQVPVTCGGAAVFPGDVIVGDADGVVVVPQELVEVTVGLALELERKERFIIDKIRGGAPIFGTYPLAGALLEEYREVRHAQT